MSYALSNVSPIDSGHAHAHTYPSMPTLYVQMHTHKWTYHICNRTVNSPISAVNELNLYRATLHLEDNQISTTFAFSAQHDVILKASHREI